MWSRKETQRVLPGSFKRMLRSEKHSSHGCVAIDTSPAPNSCTWLRNLSFCTKSRDHLHKGLECLWKWLSGFFQKTHLKFKLKFARMIALFSHSNNSPHKPEPDWGTAISLSAASPTSQVFRMENSRLSMGHHRRGSQNSTKKNIKYNMPADLRMSLTRLPSAENSPKRGSRQKNYKAEKQE